MGNVVLNGDTIVVKADIWRQGGQWKIRVLLPQWVFTELEETELQATVRLERGMEAGYSTYAGHLPYLLANAKFEFIDPKKSNE